VTFKSLRMQHCEQAWPVEQTKENDMLGNTRGKRCRLSTAHYEIAWNYHLAQGSAVIASTLTPVTLHAAIMEAVEEFIKTYGRDDLSVFLTLLAARLDRREKPIASVAVRHLEAHGSLPNVPESEAIARRARGREPSKGCIRVTKGNGAAQNKKIAA
jgi:hypothetical protein